MLVGKPKDLINELLKLDFDKVYQVDVKEYKTKRSLEQNKMLWELVHRIAKVTHHTDMEIYCSALEEADAKSDYVITATDMEQALRKSFRGVKFIRMQEVNGKDCYVYKVYLGSSKMNTKEMTELLDIVMDMCYKAGVEIYE